MMVGTGRTSVPIGAGIMLLTVRAGMVQVMVGTDETSVMIRAGIALIMVRNGSTLMMVRALPMHWARS